MTKYDQAEYFSQEMLGYDKETPWISGCTVMPNGFIVLCDHSNKMLKLLNNVFIVTESLEVCDPWDVSVVDINNVIVTLPNKQQLQYVQVIPQMKAGRSINFDEECWGVDVSGDHIYVCCLSSGEVKVLDLNGNLKHRFREDDLLWFTGPSI